MVRGMARLLALSSAAVVALCAAYATAAWALALVPPTPTSPPAATTLEAYVVSNGVHTDLVLPLKSGGTDWTEVFPPNRFPAFPADSEFVAIGWGDRDFYLHTPRWRDLTPGRAIGALSGRGRTLLHVTWLRRQDLGRRTWKLPLDGQQAAALAEHVRQTLASDAAGRAVPVAGHYGPTDAFFEARGAYDLFTTCNTWTGDALRRAGAPVSPWTPFAGNVTRHLAPAFEPAREGAPPPRG